MKRNNSIFKKALGIILVLAVCISLAGNSSVSRAASRYKIKVNKQKTVLRFIK